MLWARGWSRQLERSEAGSSKPDIWGIQSKPSRQLQTCLEHTHEGYHFHDAATNPLVVLIPYKRKKTKNKTCYICILPSIARSVCRHGIRADRAPAICSQTLFLLMLWLCLQDAQKPMFLICSFLRSLNISVSIMSYYCPFALSLELISRREMDKHF